MNRPSSTRGRRLLREGLLTGGAILGVICLLAAAASMIFGITPLVFRSGSMSPLIETGALGVARSVPVDALAVGDVVSVVNGSGARITHRIYRIDRQGSSAVLTLKGDANPDPDAEPYVVQQVDLVLFHVEKAGYLVSALTHPLAVFLGGALVGVLIMLAFGPQAATDLTGQRGRRTPRPPTRARRAASEGVPRQPVPLEAPPTGSGVGRAVTETGLVVVVLSLLLGGVVRETDAAWGDGSGAVTGSFATLALISAPTLSCSGLGVASVRFTWTAVPGVTGYELTITGGSPSTTTYPAGTLTATIGGLIGSGTATVRARTVYPSTTWYSNPSNARTYTIVVVALCS